MGNFCEKSFGRFLSISASDDQHIVPLRRLSISYAYRERRPGTFVKIGAMQIFCRWLKVKTFFKIAQF